MQLAEVRKDVGVIRFTVRRRFFANLLFVTALFPYLSPIGVPFDVQPYALSFSVLVLLLFFGLYPERLRLPVALWLLTMPMLYGLFLLFLAGVPTFGGLRSLSGYVSLFAIATVSYLCAQDLNLRIFIAAAYMWLIVGSVQIFVSPRFLAWMVPRFTDLDFYRGASALAPEPSHYATVAFFMMLLNELFYVFGLYSKKVYWSLLFVLMFQVLISFSGFGVLLLLSFIGLKLLCFLLCQRFSKALFVAATLTWVIVGTVSYVVLAEGVLNSTRGMVLLKMLLTEPSLLMEDGSVRSRVEDIVLPVKAMTESIGIGMGLGTWGEHHNVLRSGQPTEWVFSTDRSERIMSGWGTALFEIGAMGVMLILIISFLILRGIAVDRGRKGFYLLVFFSVHVAIINSVPLSFPLFPFFIGVLSAFVWRGREALPSALTRKWVVRF